MISLTQAQPATVATDALVVVLARRPTDVPDGRTGPVPLGDVPDDVVRLVESSADVLGLTGDPDVVHRLPATRLRARSLVLVGAGAADTPESVRRAVGAATRTLTGLASAAVVLPDDEPATLAAAAEGALLGAYTYTRYRQGPEKDTAQRSGRPPLAEVQLLLGHRPTKTETRSVQRAQVLAEAVHAVRDLVNTAPNDLYPAAFAEAARAATKGVKGLKVTVMDPKALAAGGFGGLLGVGQGSARPPHLVKVTYSPARAKRSVALVGKGITFDSGGISLKPPADMDEMKSDMAGAATVLATVVAAARLGLPVAVTAWLALAENMPSGTAQRPSDVLTVHGGTTVEVLNTDAEGRLVLADALVAAVAEEPDLVVDVATLTGAQIVALGRRVAAVMGTDDARDDVVAAAAAAGESVWPMPLPEDLKPGLKSTVADLANVGERWGGMLLAGLFLAEFVGTTPWAHLDIAGPAYNAKDPYGYTPVGGTGMGVRTLVTLLESHG
ncbi:MAG: leucyl aminopeptidase [Micrococcales bacterium]|nr:leucyl aminopeptidase [Micrococcales bacterium]